MGVFNIDIEKFYQEIKNKNGQLKGFFCIQYPIYCIHANIRDVSPEPLDDIDQIICDFLFAKPDFKPTQIASLIGTTKTFVELRIEVLLKEKLLKRDGKAYIPTENGMIVFQERKKKREHERSFDFFLDGINLKPLPTIFYTFYRSKLISENDSYYHTNAKGETRIFKPFNPDIVHTPPDMPKIIDGIFQIPSDQRDEYGIPVGLVNIDRTAFTRQTFHLLISVSAYGEKLVKEVIDGSASYSMSEGMSYYDAMKKNIRIFEPVLEDRIKNMIFKITTPAIREDRESQYKSYFSSNWSEIDRYKHSENSCFSFSSEDLLKMIDEVFMVKDVLPQSIVNTEKSIEISLNKDMLMNSPDRNKLIENLIRERDYHLINKTDGGVFLVYLYYSTSDKFIERVLRFKKIIKLFRGTKNFRLNDFRTAHPEFDEDLRELLTAAGEPEILEKLDIEQFMMKI